MRRCLQRRLETSELCVIEIRDEVTTTTAVRQVRSEFVKPELRRACGVFLGISGVTDFCLDAPALEVTRQFS